MQAIIIAYKSSKIHFSRYGNGREKVICFHGYGETAAGFSFLENDIPGAFSFYAIDLPFHGQTEWKEPAPFSHYDLMAIIEQLLQQEGMAMSDARFSLLGFSLGGRTALSLYQSHPQKVNRLVLLAPDGLKVNFWYWLATQTWIGNSLFAYTMKKPGWFFGLLKLLNKLKLVNASVFKFVRYYIGDPQARELLYNRWMVLRKLKPNLERIKSAVRANQTPTRLVYGKHDRIILASVGRRFEKGIEPWCKINIIEAGHQVLHEKHTEDILAALQH